MPSPVTFILNSPAGGTDKESACRYLAHTFAGYGFESRILLAGCGSDVYELARRAVQEDSQAVVAGGGDGTVNAVAAALAGSHTPMGILPLGTFNHFAHVLRIPTDLDSAASTLMTGSVARVDVGLVNGHLFLNNSSLGLYPQMVSERQQQQRSGREKWIAFVEAAASALRRYPLLRVRLHVNGKELARTTPFLFVGNNRYAISGLKIGERDVPTRGELCVYLVRAVNRFGLLRLALKALLGRLGRNDQLDAFSASEFTVETRRKLVPVATDGEIQWMQSPLHYRILPRALSVIVPGRGAWAA